MDFQGPAEFLVAAKNALDIYRGLRAELPKGTSTARFDEQIVRAEAALKSSEAAAAKALGYHLCQCTFPPKIMLWKEATKSHNCPNPQCGKIDRWPEVKTRPPGGPTSWMAG